MAAVVTRVGIKRLIRCSSCIITMIYKYYHERSVSQTGQGGPFSFSIDMNLPAKFDGHIGGKNMLHTTTACKRHSKLHRNWAWNLRYGNTPLQELTAWVANLSMELFTLSSGMVLSFFNWDSDQVPFAVFGWKTFLSCLSKWCKKFRYLLFADGHSCGSQETVNEAGLDTKYGKTALRLETVEISWNLEQYSQSSIESRPMTQATLPALAAESWPGPAALDRKLKVFTMPAGQARGSSDVHLTESEPSMPIALLKSFPQSLCGC